MGNYYFIIYSFIFARRSNFGKGHIISYLHMLKNEQQIKIETRNNFKN